MNRCVLGNRLCEVGPSRSLFANPRHHYTTALLDAIPSPTSAARAERRRAPIDREVPSPIDPPSGCRFRTRCPRAEEICALEAPPMTEVGADHTVACHFPVAAAKPEEAAIAAGRTTTWNP